MAAAGGGKGGRGGGRGAGGKPTGGRKTSGGKPSGGKPSSGKPGGRTSPGGKPSTPRGATGGAGRSAAPGSRGSGRDVAPGSRGTGRSSGPGPRGGRGRPAEDRGARWDEPDRIGEQRDGQRDGRPILYGRNAVHEALRARKRPVHRIWATSATLRGESWLHSKTVEVVESDELTRLAGTDAHQGVCAQTDGFPYTDGAALLRAETPLIVALDEVQDVQNLGAIARSAECAGATGLVIPERRSAEVTPAAAKASAGAVEHLPIARVRNLADWLVEAKAAGCWIYGAAGQEGAVPWTEPDYGGGIVLVMGAEGTGLRPRVAETCDALVALPLRGRISSLNVSAAAAALLYEIVRGRTA